jgi:5-methylcytosine-specific restriction endonuclease McrBC regulatory subunit McrC
MTSKFNIHTLKDWSQIPDSSFLSNIDFTRPEFNFGIHFYNNHYWTSGFVGIGRLFDSAHKPLQHNGREEIVLINSQYGMNPWKMLEKVITDNEFELYITELENNNKFLFKVFYDQPMINISLGNDFDSDLLYALNFINSCFKLCHKGLKKKMDLSEHNYTAKIKGHINISQNIKRNTSHGRNDRFYCTFINFSIDNLENRIIKATLLKCKKIIEQRFEQGVESIQRAVDCLNALRTVKDVQVQLSDFNRVSLSGLYIYYKPVLQQAHCIFRQKYPSFSNNPNKINKGIYTIPYMINMETLFEFYARVILKKMLDSNKYSIDSYAQKWFLSKNISNVNETQQHIHLLSYCMPDIVIRDKRNKTTYFVIDAKYKSNERSERNDSHQLMSYVLLTGVTKCGFIFPGDVTCIKKMNNKYNFLELNSNLLSDLKYFEILIGNNPQKKDFDDIFK